MNNIMVQLLECKARLGILILLGITVSACVSPPDKVYPLGVVSSIDKSLISEGHLVEEVDVSTAKNGDFILQQTVQNAVILNLENDVDPIGNINLSVIKRTLNLRKNEKFYLAVNQSEKPSLVACSIGRPAVFIPRLNPGARSNNKVCFDLLPLNENFNIREFDLKQVDYYSDSFFFMRDEFLVITESASPYQKLVHEIPANKYRVKPSAKFKKIELQSDDVGEAPSLALRYIASESGGQLELVYVADGRPLKLDLEHDVIALNKKMSFPRQFVINGAKVEVLAMKNDVLAYRILSGFDTSSKFMMDLSE